MHTMHRQPLEPTPRSVMSAGASAANTVLLISPRADLRQDLRRELVSLRWNVQEAASGAEAWLRQEEHLAGAVLLDEWLPDLTPREFAQQFLQQFPTVDIVSMSGEPLPQSARNARRNELLLAIRTVDAAADGVVARELPHRMDALDVVHRSEAAQSDVSLQESDAHNGVSAPGREPTAAAADVARVLTTAPHFVLPDVLGGTAAMRELGKMVRLAAPHSATVLIEGETGTGKELVAHAVHRLSPRNHKPFVTLNCAAIPEQLLEAELFGHTRGAFTGAVTSRTGRIEAAHGGTLFLDEIGEMPLALQAKMLRFLECGEIQRIGENETSRVDVRIVAATHQPLEEHATTGRFRLDLFHRLAVFPVTVPPLRERLADLPMLVQYILSNLAKNLPQRPVRADALDLLLTHAWPGNVRELVHALQRAMILSTEDAEIRKEHILLRRAMRPA